MVTFFPNTRFVKWAIRKITTREIKYLVTTPGWTGKEYPKHLVTWMNNITDPAHPQYKEVQEIKKDYLKRVEALNKLKNNKDKYILGDDEVVYNRYKFPAISDWEIDKYVTNDSYLNIPKSIRAFELHKDFRNPKHPQYKEMQDYYNRYQQRVIDMQVKKAKEKVAKSFLKKYGVAEGSSDIGLYSISAMVEELVRYALREMKDFMTITGFKKTTAKDEIMNIVDRELENTGRRMLAEAKKLMPAPATVPRVTVASLAGRDFSMISERDEQTGQKTWLGADKPAKMRKNAQGYITAYLGVERTQRIAKMGYLPINMPSNKQIAQAGGATKYKKPFVAESKRTTTLHLTNQRLHKSHVTKLDSKSTGDLRRGAYYLITPEKDIIMGNVMPYWTDVEFGTGIRGKMHPHPSIKGRGKRIYVPRNYLKENKRSNYGNFPGMRAQPHIYPAYMSELRPFYYRLKKQLDIYIKNYYSYQGKLKI